MRRILARASVLLLVAGGVALAGADRTDAGGASVSIVDFAFQPGGVEVPVGGSVSWSNNGETDHTVTGGSFNSGTLSPGSGFSTTFSTPGTFSYSCTLHPEMTGSVSVTAPVATPAPVPESDAGAEGSSVGGSEAPTSPVGATPTATG